VIILAILILLLAVTNNINYYIDYIKWNRIVIIIFILGSYLAYNTLNVEALTEGIGIYGGVFKITVMSQIFDIFLFLTGSFVCILSSFLPFYFKYTEFEINKLEVKEYGLLLLFTVLGGSLLISSQNLISLYLSLELQSFTLYILSTSQIRSFNGTSGGLKYFLLGGLSSGFILLGCSLLYAYTGTLNLEYIFIIYSNSFSHFFMDPCLLILFAGLLFKVSAAPFHHWAPDVYSDVPTNSTTWLIVFAKLSILMIMFLLVHNIHNSLSLHNLTILEQDYSYSSLGVWTNVLTLSAFFSLVIGTVLGISQSKIKRLFAYSTITHVGFMLLALSINTISSIDGFIFYLIQYTLTNINLFFIIISWGYLYTKYFFEDGIILWPRLFKDPNSTDFFKAFKFFNNEWIYTPVPFITQLKGMHYTDPFLAFCLAVTIFSLTGVPPLIGFFAKQQVLLACVQYDYFFLSFVAIFTSVIGAAYYLRIIKFIYFYDNVFYTYFILDSDYYHFDQFDFVNVSWNKFLPKIPSYNLSLVIALLTNILLLFIIKPYILFNIVYMMTVPYFLI
jgi:NADH-ubiquinone oxidoreductase chain 2